ncbi:cation efflux system protein [Ferrigenium kumadai]|uniref:Cation efflux system protein n=1 Tax=Ferrigenium kumadai TaxID=1682490 RepID=A0AAN1T038_9PROT|nr:efflux RND transporter periplasmic adaptor subunit [Ferrigenium kumadai]BBI99826.1 cation efflux system protein [Ferrigenium kumadai]
MKKVYGIVVVLTLLGVAAGGYWLGARTAVPAVAADAAKAERKVLYYRNPMGLPDTSPVSKKDAMGMDYVPVYEGEAETTNGKQIVISTDKVQKLGVKSEVAAMRMLDKTLRVAGRIEIDERRTFVIAPKFEGWVERLYVNTTGQAVGKGQPLFEVYSPDLVSARRERELAAQGIAALKDADEEARDGMRRLAESSAARLKNWDIADGRVNGNRVTFHAPVSGIVLEKNAVQGMRFMPGEMLYRIADLSSVWVVADVAEQDIGQIKAGGRVQVSVDAYPERQFDGKVDFVSPTLDSATRTVRVRIEIPNPQGLLKPAMFAQVVLPVGSASPVLTVPVSAVIDSGLRQIVLVQLAQGRFEPREVKLGSRSDRYVEVLEGIAEGEQVVTAANFLIDAESNLRAALGGMSGPVRQAQDRQATPAASVQSPAAEPGKATAQLKTAVVGHQAQGTLEAVNADGTLSITHGPIASLGWPGMTMDFALANSALLDGIQPGSAISFEIVERKPDEWVITKLQARTQHQHEGH